MLHPKVLTLALILTAGPAALATAAIALPSAVTAHPLCEQGYMGMTVTAGADGPVFIKELHPRGPARAGGSPR